MKETNSIETRLSSWRPRRPSAKLKSRIFAEAQALDLSKIAAWSLRLAPAAVCLLVAISALNPAGDFSRASFGHDAQPVTLASNDLAMPPDIYVQEHNELEAFTFEWTNLRNSTSSISSFSPGK